MEQVSELNWGSALVQCMEAHYIKWIEGSGWLSGYVNL
jgi:hypothetical protein